MESGTKLRCCTLTFLIFCLLLPAFGQQDEPSIPTNFKLDFETATRLRPQLMALSREPKDGSPGRVVLERLIRQVLDFSSQEFSWELRIAETNDLNAYSSPDGTIYVDNRLAQLASPSAGLWAAILSHEIAHVLRRDWARRYLYQKTLERDRSIPLLLGEPGSPSGTWSSSQKASQSLAQFCRRLEVEADRDGLMLMARAGYHPDFAPALHHLLHAQGSATGNTSLYAMHPCWEERDLELMRDYVAASVEFEHRWQEWYASPGGESADHRVHGNPYGSEGGIKSMGGSCADALRESGWCPRGRLSTECGLGKRGTSVLPASFRLRNARTDGLHFAANDSDVLSCG
ncbi:MAG TPA: M48 family metalloprotease [Terriglobales bacterium]|nr:M48 family metalloprotease [Terriglobales bacterium]